MASKGPKRESLSRYFKDLDEFEDSDGDSDDETSQVDGTSNEKSSGVTITKNNSVQNSTADSSKLAGKLDLETEKELPPTPTTNTNTTTTTTSSNKGADVNIATEKKSKLPSASECLSTRSNPTFLKVSETKEINWDAREKRLGGGDDHDDAAATNLTTNAVPPPSSYEPITDPGIKVVDSEGRKRKTVWSDLEDQNTSTKAYKVHKDDGDDEGNDGS